jgi:outer membrane protein TolC
LLQGIYDKRLTNAQTLANAYQEKLKNGEANILELNKVRLNLLNIRKEAEKNTIDRNGLLSQLAGNNNGIMVDFADTVFLHAEIPAEFEKWYADTAQYFPDLEIIKREIETSRKQEQLYLALGLPRLTAGYMSENIPGNQFQGVIAGISVPLWEKRNTVKQAKARTVALQGAETDFRVKVYNQLKTAHSKIIALQKTVDDYRSTLGSYDNAKFLDKALAKGEINLIDYIQELSFYYRSVDELLATENELNRSVAELYQFME